MIVAHKGGIPALGRHLPDWLSPAMKKPLQIMDLQRLYILAEWTGLEPATPGVTGRYSNQLNYHSW